MRFGPAPTPSRPLRSRGAARGTGLALAASLVLGSATLLSAPALAAPIEPTPIETPIEAPVTPTDPTPTDPAPTDPTPEAPQNEPETEAPEPEAEAPEQALNEQRAPVAPGGLTELVNPYIGTQDDGNTYPGATVPFGMVQLSPDNGHNTGYDYTRENIRGFSLVHLSGVGCGLGGALPVLPTTGAVTETNNADYELPYSHGNETAYPGYYSVGLGAEAGEIQAELTATEHTGVQRYTFPETTEANVLINAGQALNNVTSSEITVVDARTIVAHVVTDGFCQDTNPVDFYTRTVFDRDIVSFGTWTGDAVTDAATASGVDEVGAFARFDTTDGDLDVEAVTSLSYVDANGATANLDAEYATFDDAHAAADAQWEERLGSIEPEGGSETDLRVFYSALYRSYLAPNTGTDVDGRYRGWDQQNHVAEGFTYYQNLSLWDTYRTQQQLLALLAPDESRDMAISVVRAGQQGGWLPRWGFGTIETNVMTGDPGTAFLVSAWSQGLLEGFEEETYALLTQNADGVPPADNPANGRAGNLNYIENGFVPHEPSIAGKPGDFDLDHGGSATLEYALSDAVLSTMAQGLGHTDDAARYAERGENYRAIFDTRTDNFRARNAAGIFVGSDEPAYAEGFHEGTALQYRWLVPQDMQGLFDLLGGTEAAGGALDDFFAYDELLVDPEGTARNLWVTGTYDYYGETTYNPNNEPDLHSPYAYLWAGQPWKTSDVVSAAMTLFTDEPNGVTGNDDLGTMSAWYILSALGIYPIVPGTDVWGLSAPAFDRATVQLDEGFYGTDSLVIEAPGASTDARYIQSVSAGGVEIEQGYIGGRELATAGTLSFELGTQPSEWATGEDAAPAPLTTPGDTEARVFTAVPGGVAFIEPGGTLDLPIEIVAQGNGERSGTVRVTGGGLITAGETTEWSATSNGLPATVETTVPLVAAANARPGSYPITLTVTDAEGATAEWSGAIAIADGSPIAGAFDNAGIGDLGVGNANFDGLGNFIARSGLAGAGLVQGVRSTVPGTNLQFVLGRAEAGEPDNILANGQTLELPEWWSEATALSIVGASNNGTFGGDLTLTYSDGSTETARVDLADWCSGSNPPAGNISVAQTPQRGEGTGTGGGGCGMYATAPLPVDPTKTLVSVTLPVETRFHVFALATDAVAPVPTYSPTVAFEKQSVTAGETNVALGRGFEPGVAVTAILESGPVALEAGMTDAEGAIDIAFSTAGLVAGTHSVTISQVIGTGETIEAVGTFVVAAVPGGGTGPGDGTDPGAGSDPADLAATGINATAAFALLTILLAAGIALVLVRRRRRRLS